MKSFLRQARAFLSKTPRSQPIIGCFGNEAADADSIVSALCYAYLQNCLTANVSETCPRFVPVVTTARKELHLRREVGLLLNMVGLSYDDLICYEELPSYDSMLVEHASADRFSSQRQAELSGNWAKSFLEATRLNCTNPRTQFHLLDHNVLSRRMQADVETWKSAHSSDQLGIGLVNAILDHHKDAGLYLETCSTGLGNREVAYDNDKDKPLVGSCCTLVGELMLELLAQEEMGGPKIVPKEDVPKLGLLLTGVILLDTVNMDPRMGKGTARDGRVLAEIPLNRYLSSPPPVGLMSETSTALLPRTSKELFLTLKNAKTARSFWVSLTAAEALSLDYKRFASTRKSFGMSSVLLPIQLLARKADFVEEVWRSFCVEGLDLLVVMALVEKDDERGKDMTSETSSHHNDETALCELPLRGGEPYRQLLLLSRHKEILEAFHRQLNTTSMLSLELETLEPPALCRFRFDGEECQWYSALYHQHNLKMSRKQVAPLLTSFLDSLEA